MHKRTAHIASGIEGLQLSSGLHCVRISTEISQLWRQAAQCVFVLVRKWQRKDRHITAFTGLQLPPRAPTSYRSVPSSTVNDLLQHSEQRQARALPVAASVAVSGTATYLVSLHRLDDQSDQLRTCSCMWACKQTLYATCKQKGIKCLQVCIQKSHFNTRLTWTVLRKLELPPCGFMPPCTSKV